MASRTPQAIAEGYFNAWRDKDFSALRELLHDDVTFQGPFDSFDNADALIAAIMPLSGMVKTGRPRRTDTSGNRIGCRPVPSRTDRRSSNPRSAYRDIVSLSAFAVHTALANSATQIGPTR